MQSFHLRLVSLLMLGMYCLPAVLSHQSLQAQPEQPQEEPPTFRDPYQNEQTSEQERWQSMQTRRAMLQRHQWAGLLTWGLWLATNLEGERIASSHARVGEQSMQYLWLSDPQTYTPLYLLYRENAEWHTTRSSNTHRSLAAATSIMYLLTASQAIFAPAAYQETSHTGLDSIWWHKLFAFIHFGALLALPAIAGQAEEGPAGVQRMRTIGWTGFGALTFSLAVVYF